MDEAAQCDRVALIQKGEILDINTPQNIVNSFSHKLFALKCDNMYELNIESQTNKNTHSAYLFGETIHWVAKSEECKMNFISEINAKNFKNFEILQIQPSIEDCFMELMTK
jgi:ABC-type multidrug transport system ATPase subunit